MPQGLAYNPCARGHGRRVVKTPAANQRVELRTGRVRFRPSNTSTHPVYTSESRKIRLQRSYLVRCHR